MTDLKPCPACGSDDLWEGEEATGIGGSDHWVECCDCGMRGPEKYQNDPVTYHQAWNALPRHDPGTVAVPREFLDELATQAAAEGRTHTLKRINDVLAKESENEYSKLEGGSGKCAE